MSVIEFVRNRLMAENDKYAVKSPDHYDFWEQHIKLVVKEAVYLAETYGADREIVELGALLHDIALVSEIGTRAEHHENGRKIAERILQEYGYPSDKTSRVLGCILHHRSSRYAENLEELCVADADILAHFDNIPMCFCSALKYNKVQPDSVYAWVRYFERDYDDLSERTKILFKPRYDLLMDVLFGALL